MNQHNTFQKQKAVSACITSIHLGFAEQYTWKVYDMSISACGIQHYGKSFCVINYEQGNINILIFFQLQMTLTLSFRYKLAWLNFALSLVK